MKTLILPVAGKSSRFPNMRPKWLLTMPDGKLMLEKAIEKLNMENFDRVVVVCLAEHIQKYFGEGQFERILSNIPHENVEACILSEHTSSQSETVAKALQQANVEGAFFIKDCDNVFSVNWNGENEIAVLDLNNVELIDAKNKSYVNIDSLGNISNIVEKQVVSNYFCCGGYGFKDSKLFLEHFNAINQTGEIYISHVIYSMLMSKERFRIINADSYMDWGTLREYQSYMRSYMTLFCDVDGVLLYNGSKFGNNGWKTLPIEENLSSISELQKKGRIYLVITSSRPESEIEYIKSTLKNYDIIPDQFVMGLPHAKRVLVNDFSSTNSYPTAISVNLQRDAKMLSQILESISN